MLCRTSHRNASRRLRRRLRCEALEDRRLLATYAVSSTADGGAGSLREAIDLANATAGVPDEIVFDETLFSTPQAIRLDSQLPTITDALAIVRPGAELLAMDGPHGADRGVRQRVPGAEPRGGRHGRQRGRQLGVHKGGRHLRPWYGFAAGQLRRG